MDDRVSKKLPGPPLLLRRDPETDDVPGLIFIVAIVVLLCLAHAVGI